MLVKTAFRLKRHFHRHYSLAKKLCHHFHNLLFWRLKQKFVVSKFDQPQPFFEFLYQSLDVGQSIFDLILHLNEFSEKGYFNFTGN